MSKTKKTRITVHMKPTLLSELEAQLKSLHLRRDAYLNHTLDVEVDELEKIPANSPRARHYFRQLRGAIPEKARLAITLDDELVSRINAVCRAKGVVRDAFIESYIEFLVNGDKEGGSCISPLVKAAAILSNPRHEYDYSRPPYIEHHLSDEILKEICHPRFLENLFRKQAK
jgi:hypothetical protein